MTNAIFQTSSLPVHHNTPPWAFHNQTKTEYECKCCTRETELLTCAGFKLAGRMTNTRLPFVASASDMTRCGKPSSRPTFYHPKRGIRLVNSNLVDKSTIHFGISLGSRIPREYFPAILRQVGVIFSYVIFFRSLLEIFKYRVLRHGSLNPSLKTRKISLISGECRIKWCACQEQQVFTAEQ